MQTIIKKHNYSLLITFLLLLSIGTLFTSCKKDDKENNITELYSYGPMPIARGAELRFIGNKMDRISSIVLPGNMEITDFTSKTADLITLTVPQNAVEGLIVLKLTTGEEISTKTPLGFSEPMSITSFTPATIKPGAELTITGDYLNLVKEVIFSENVSVEVTSENRAELKVIVPAEAQTGKIAISNGAEDPIVIYSETELTINIPVVSSIAPNPVKAGTNLTITGINLDLTTKVTFGGDKEVTSFVSQSATSLVVAVPTDATSGAVTIEVASGIEIEAGDITLVEPVAAIENIQASYEVDETVVISGTNLDLVTTAAFTGSEAAEVTLTDGKINLTVTAAVQSGSITLTMANGSTVSVEGFVTTKPLATLPSNATPLDELNIVSTLGSRVKTVMFGNLEAEATATANGFSVIVPLDAVTGNVTLVMDNSETVALNSMTINTYTFCAVSEFAEETTTIGDLLKCTVVNGSNLTEVRINDVSTEFILNGNILFVNVGRNVGTQKLTLVSNDGTEVDYNIEIVASGIVETVLYDIPLEVAGWGGVDLPITIDVPMPANSKIRLRIAQANSELQVMDGYWGQGPNWAISDAAEQNNIRFTQEELSAGYVDVDFSGFHDENGNPWWDGTIKFNADGVIISSVSLIVDYSAPTAIWEGSAAVSGWSTSFTEMTWGGYDFSGLQVGQTMYVYYTSDDGGTMRLGNGNWSAIPSTIAIATDSGDTSGEGNIQITAGSSYVSFVLTADDIATIQNDGGFGAYGGDFTVTKVALK